MLARTINTSIALRLFMHVTVVIGSCNRICWKIQFLKFLQPRMALLWQPTTTTKMVVKSIVLGFLLAHFWSYFILMSQWIALKGSSRLSNKTKSIIGQCHIFKWKGYIDIFIAIRVEHYWKKKWAAILFILNIYLWISVIYLENRQLWNVSCVIFEYKLDHFFTILIAYI